jgi:glucan phosphoethanolaminetransferase (alkaline phosphatase superfamily)
VTTIGVIALVIFLLILATRLRWRVVFRRSRDSGQEFCISFPMLYATGYAFYMLRAFKANPDYMNVHIRPGFEL